MSGLGWVGVRTCVNALSIVHKRIHLMPLHEGLRLRVCGCLFVSFMSCLLSACMSVYLSCMSVYLSLSASSIGLSLSRKVLSVCPSTSIGLSLSSKEVSVCLSLSLLVFVSLCHFLSGRSAVFSVTSIDTTELSRALSSQNAVNVAITVSIRSDRANGVCNMSA